MERKPLIDLLCSDITFVSDTLTWMVNFPTRIPDYDFHSPAYLISFFLEKEPYYSKNIVDV